MDILENILKLFSSYPTWARVILLANVVCIAGILSFARSSIGEAAAQPVAVPLGYVLRIKGVRLFPGSEQDEIQCTAFVNGTEYRYPSVAGVDWLAVAPTMSGQTFVLPKAERYEIRFELQKRRRSNREDIARLLSQETLTLSKPATGVYDVHGFDPTSGTRSGTVDGEIAYALEPSQ